VAEAAGFGGVTEWDTSMPLRPSGI
jgi:hypothetical protein